MKRNKIESTRGGRPTVRTRKIEAQVVKALRSGRTYETIGALVGVHPRTISRWIAEKSVFGFRCHREIALIRGRVEQHIYAVARGEVEYDRGAKIGQWLLSKWYPDVYGHAVGTSKASSPRAYTVHIVESHDRGGSDP